MRCFRATKALAPVPWPIRPAVMQRNALLVVISLLVIAGATLFLLLRRKNAKVKLRLRGPLSREHFDDILKVGLPAMLSPIQTVATILVITSIAGWRRVLCGS